MVGVPRECDHAPVDLPTTWPDNLPPTLHKATQGYWRYAMQLRTGQKFLFTGLVFLGNGWIHLDFVEQIDLPFPGDFSFGRGVDVRISDIVWVADCNS